ncbi:MAG: rod shape-determining protein MreD [Bacilli bacterium]
MKLILLFASLFVSLLLETTLFRVPFLASYAPNLVVLGLVMAGVFRGSRTGAVLGVLIGLTQDIGYGAFLGQTAFAYAVIGWMGGYFRSLVMRESLLLGLLLTGVGTEAFTWLTYGASRLFGEAPVDIHAVVAESARSSLVTMGYTIVLYYVYRRWFRVKPRVGYAEDSTTS